MAFERVSDTKIVGDGLDAFVDSRLKLLSNQIAIRNADDELRFVKAVLTDNISLDEQLNYRKEQFKRSSDDPSEKRRITQEIAGLNDRIEVQKFNDDFTSQVIDFESGISSIDTIVNWLKEKKTNTTDQNLRDSIDKQLVAKEAQRFTIQMNVLNNQTQFATNDKTATVLNDQITRVGTARNQALLSGNQELVTTYDLHLQSLTKAKAESEIANDAKNFAIQTMSGYTSATAQLDQFNNKIANASPNTPVTIGGTTYNSAQEYWRTQRDTYVSDEGANGFFSRFKDEQLTTLSMKQSNNTFSNNDISNSTASFNSLAARPELQSYTFKLNAVKQDVVQKAVDAQASTVLNNYSIDYDVNKALNALNTLKNFGANVDSIQNKVITQNAELKGQQVGGIIQAAQDALKADPGMSADAAVKYAQSVGAGSVLSPNQLATKTESQLATEQVNSASKQSFNPDPRTTVNNPSATQATATPPPPVAPQINDLTGKYGIVGKTVYRKSDNKAFTSEQEFFQDSGLSSFQNVKFDTAYVAPTPGASTQLNQQPIGAAKVTTPTAAPTTYKVLSGDTLSGISQRLLGDSKRYAEIAKANNISNPNLIKVGQELIIPK